MAESWVRLWAGTTSDPKFKTVARKSGRPLVEVIALFVHLMLAANDHEERGRVDGVSVEDIASALDMDEQDVQAILDCMQGRLIDDGRLTGWDRRQPAREDSGNAETGALSSTERSRLHRAKKQSNAVQHDATHCNAMQRTATQCNAPEAEAEADTEAEAETALTHTTVYPPAQPSKAGAVCVAIRAEGIQDANTSHPELLALLERGAEVQQFVDAARIAKSKGKGFGYILGTVKGQMADARRLPTPGLATSRLSTAGQGAPPRTSAADRRDAGRAAACRAFLPPGTPANATRSLDDEHRTLDITPATAARALDR